MDGECPGGACPGKRDDKRCQASTDESHITYIYRISHLHDGGQSDGTVLDDSHALVAGTQISGAAYHRHVTPYGHVPCSYLIAEEG